jgi:putative addiction module antidote
MTHDQRHLENQLAAARRCMDKYAGALSKLAEMERLEKGTQMNITVRKIGNSEGVILPKEMLERLNLKAGDTLTVIQREQSLELLPSTISLAEQLEAAREGMAQYRVALRELAK